jgi:hypothetical protein
MDTNNLFVTDAAIIRPPKQYRFNPQRDITAWEAAKCAEILVLFTQEFFYHVEDFVELSEPEVRRHFECIQI